MATLARSHLSKLRRLSACAVLLIPSMLLAGDLSNGPGELKGNGSEVCHVAKLRNEFVFRYVRHEAVGTATRLWLCADAGSGYVDIPSEQIENFEQGQSAVPTEVANAPETSASSLPPAKDSLTVLITSIARRYQLDADFLYSVIKAESGFNAAAISPKGAQGLMQLMPETAARLGVNNVFDPAANIEGGTKYLRELLDRYQGDAVKALAAYNAGPKRVAQYGGIPPYRETWAYVAQIIGDFNRKKFQQRTHSNTASADQ